MSVPSAAPLRSCALLLFLVAGSRQLSLLEFEVPYAVEVGGTAELRCRYQLGANESAAALYVKWWWTPAGSSYDDRKQIYQHIAGAGQAAEPIHRTKMEIKEDDTIVLRDLTPSDSGTYECEVSNIDEIREHGELIVYTKGTGPELNITSVADAPEGGEDVLIECEAADVAPLPHLIVIMSNGNEINMTEVLTGPSSEGLYSIFANATRRKEDVDAGDVRCELLYENPNVTHTQYVDIETYDPTGGAAPAQLPAAAAPPPPPEVSPESLQNSRDASYRAHCSWTLPAVAAILVHLHSIIL